MKNVLPCCALAAVIACASGSAFAQNLLSNGNLDRVGPVEIVPGFFLPKPLNWVNEGFRTITGPYEDEMSSEPWAGPAPTPVTADGLLNVAPYNTNPDWAVFYKGFSGNVSPDGFATGHLYQDVPGTPGTSYTFSGWAGAEPNFLTNDAVFALEFLNGGGTVIGGSILSLLPQLFVDNGEPFDYKLYSVTAVAPAGTAFVRGCASMIGARSNPAGGGQAFVIDDFSLVPAPSTGVCFLALGTLAFRRRR